jgi:hypothetical protein
MKDGDGDTDPDDLIKKLEESNPELAGKLKDATNAL